MLITSLDKTPMSCLNSNSNQLTFNQVTTMNKSDPLSSINVSILSKNILKVLVRFIRQNLNWTTFKKLLHIANDAR